MKFKSKSKDRKESKGSHRTSKAADDHLDEEIEVWSNDSFTSVASSVTAPPSQTASFYKRIQNDDFDFSSSDDSESLQEGQTNRSSDDDNLSWADNRSRSSNSNFGGGDSQGAVQKPSKKDKKKRFRKGRRKLFGGAIQEEYDGENEDAPKPSTGRRGRRLSLFGNSGHSTQPSDDQDVNRSIDGEFSVNHSSDDGCRFSQDGSQDGLGNGEAAPAAAITRGKAKRRGSLGGYFSRKENQGHQSDDAGHLSQDGASRDGLGYEDAAPSISREKPKRRGSLGGLFTKKEHHGHHSSDEGGQLSNDEGLGYGYEEAAPSVRRENGQRRGSLGGHFAKKDNQGHQIGDGGPRSIDGSIDNGLEYGYEDAAPVVTREKTKRRGSLGGLFKKESRHSPPPPDVEARHEKPHRVRRNSMFGGATENTSPVRKQDQPSVNEQSTTAASAISTSKSRPGSRRRHSLTGGTVKGGSNSKSAAAPPKDPHWIINQERKARGMYLYERSLLLDTLARSLSNELANGLPPTPTEFYGNVGRGKSLQMIHDTIMDDRGGASRKNILSEKFTEFGVALTQGIDGQFYMVALFKE